MSNFTAVVLFWYVLFTQTKFDMSLICDWYCTYGLGSRTPPHPHRPPIAREYPLATASLSGSYAAVGADSAHSQKKITRRAATRFRSVLVYLRLVSLKIVPPLFFLTEAA